MKLNRTTLIIGVLLSLMIDACKPPVVLPPTISTTGVTDITRNSAKTGGNISDDGGGGILQKGVVYGTTTNLSIETSSKTTNGQGTGSFASNLSGLLPGTTYYVKAYATNESGTSYGNQTSFKTLEDLDVVTKAVTGIGTTTAIAHGEVKGSSSLAVSERGIVWSKTTNPTLSNNSEKSGTGKGTFDVNLTGLTTNTKYYVRAYMLTSNGVAYGTEVSFTTLRVSLPDITMDAVSSISYTTSFFQFRIVNTGGEDLTEGGFVYSTTTNPDVNDTKLATLNSSCPGGCFQYSFWNQDVTNLTPNTTYYVRAYAKNSAGTAYSNQVSFKTLAYTPPVLSNSLPTSGSLSSTGPYANYSVTYYINDNGGQTITGCGVVWSTSPNPTTSNSKTTSTSCEIGTKYSYPTNLTPGAAYYMRAYATNSAGTSYSAEKVINTPTPNLDDRFAGGKVYRISGRTVWVVNTTNLSYSSKWSPSYAYTGAWNDGLYNTNTIVAYYGNGSSYAALLAYNSTAGGFSDWFLPSTYDLELIFTNVPASNFSNSAYWSSNEYNNINAFLVNKQTKAAVVTDKLQSWPVIAVRSFTY